MPTIAAIAQQVVAAGLPVFLPDTCILLDVIRATLRCYGSYVEQAAALLQLAAAPSPRCLIVTASLVGHEWAIHAPAVTDEVEKHLTKMEEQSRHFHDACHALGISLAFGRSPYTAPGLSNRLRELSRLLVDSSVLIDQDDSCRLRAFSRIVYNTPPARKSGEVKDCAILEEYLELSRLVRAAGFPRKLVFCTSNTNDYCAADGSPHANLATDFAGVNMLFTTKLPWAVHEIKT